MKKRITGLLAAFMLLGVLTACGGEVPEDASGTTDTTQETSEAPETEVVQGFQVGQMEDGIYTNEFLGISCQLSEDWTYLSNEEIAQLNGEMLESITDAELSEALSESATTQDMYAASANGLATINVIVENMGVIYGAAVDEGAYLEIAAPAVDEALAQTGMSDIQVETGTMAFAGADHSTLRVTGTMSGIPVYETMVCIKEGNYMGVITMVCYQEDITEEMVSWFTALPE